MEEALPRREQNFLSEQADDHDDEHTVETHRKGVIKRSGCNIGRVGSVGNGNLVSEAPESARETYAAFRGICNYTLV
jgi:hypothetical protein